MVNDDITILSNQIQAVKFACWGWLTSHWDEITTLNAPMRLHATKGVIGDSVRRRDRPFVSANLSHDLISWLETPDAIKAGAKFIGKLNSMDRRLYRFTELKAKGYTLEDIQQAMPELGKLRTAYGNKHGTRKVTRMTDRILACLLECLPTELVAQWGQKKAIETIIYRGNTKGFAVGERMRTRYLEEFHGESGQ